MEQTPPYFSGCSRSFRVHQPSNNIVIIEDEDEDEGDDFFPSLSEFREMCDGVFYATDEETCGGSTTFLNAPRMDYLRYVAELPLKLYNHIKLRSFELVKVCKINVIGCVFYGVTFKAKEGPSGEVLLFRGVVHIVGRTQPLYCEIKDDDEIKLKPDDNDCPGSLENHFRLLRIDG